MMFIGCVIDPEPADTETADEIDSEGPANPAIVVHGDTPAPGATGAVIDPHVCPPSLPDCGPQPGAPTAARGDAPAPGATGATIDPHVCPPSLPCGPQPGAPTAAVPEPAAP
jgi:hypothetical protein